MKTTFQQVVVYIGLLVGLILVPVGVYAADNEVGLSLSYSTVNDDGFDNGFGYGINYARAIMSNVAVEVGIDRKTFDITEMYMKGDVTTMPIRITGQYLFEPMGAIRPWLGGGIGYYLNEIDESAFDEAAALGTEDCDDLGFDCAFSTNADLNNGLGFHLGGGADYLINDNFALTIGLEYRIISPDLEVSLSCSGTDCGEFEGDFLDIGGDIDLGGFDLKIGAKYMF